MSESNDDAVGLDSQDTSPPHLQLEFKCFLIDHKTNKHVPVSQLLSVSAQSSDISVTITKTKY